MFHSLSSSRARNLGVCPKHELRPSPARTMVPRFAREDIHVHVLSKVGLDRGLLLLNADNRNLGDALFERRRLEFRSHAAHYIFGNDAVTALVAFEANLQRHIEEDGMHFVLVILSQLDPVLAFLRREVRGIHIIHGTLGDEARLEHRAQIGKYEILKTLLAHIVKQKRTHHVAGEWNHIVALEPRALP